jgi:hypothetical protein
LPSWKHTRYKVSPTQNTFSQPDFSASCPEYWLSFPLNGLPEIPPLFSYSFAYPSLILRPLEELFFSHIFLLCFLFIEGLCHDWWQSTHFADPGPHH